MIYIPYCIQYGGNISLFSNRLKPACEWFTRLFLSKYFPCSLQDEVVFSFCWRASWSSASENRKNETLSLSGMSHYLQISKKSTEGVLAHFIKSSVKDIFCMLRPSSIYSLLSLFHLSPLFIFFTLFLALFLVIMSIYIVKTWRLWYPTLLCLMFILFSQWTVFITSMYRTLGHIWEVFVGIKV